MYVDSMIYHMIMTLDHVMTGSGCPVAAQVNVMTIPSVADTHGEFSDDRGN